MNYRRKTLLILDTNLLRKVIRNSKDKNIVDYSSFEFGRSYYDIINDVEELKLTEYITVAIPQIVIEELKYQRLNQYKRDLFSIDEVISRIKKIPAQSGITIKRTEEDFNYEAYISIQIETFIKEKNIKIIPFYEDDSKAILKTLISKVLDETEVLSPFRPKDSGFKDNLIWESILRFNEIKDYDNIIFVSKDGDYKNNCNTEFAALWSEKTLEIVKDNTILRSKIEKIYSDYLSERSIIDFTETDYFKSTLNRELDSKTSIYLNDQDLMIEGKEVLVYCFNVEREKDEENTFEKIIITSNIKINYVENGEPISINIEAFSEIQEDPLMVIEINFIPQLN